MTKKDLIRRPGSPMSRLFQLDCFSDQIQEMVDSLWNRWDVDMKMFADMQPKSKFPKVNIAENDDEYEVEIALAGFNKEDIELELKENCLFIKANKKEEISEEGIQKRYLMKEISSRSFRRALNFPTKVLTDNIECSHRDGVIVCILKKDKPVLSEDDTIKINIR